MVWRFLMTYIYIMQHEFRYTITSRQSMLIKITQEKTHVEFQQVSSVKIIQYDI